MATSDDVMPATVSLVWGLSKGGSGLKLLQGPSLRAALATCAKGQESISGGCVPADNFLRAELLLLRAERP